jgi:coenzyme F420-0:L-glutamate ligase/coenzyme F420-1:gamma-L-glutamate ligase
VSEVRLIPVPGLPMIRPGDELPRLLLRALQSSGGVVDGDVVVVCQKVVSKAEGRVVRLADVAPSAFAQAIAGAHDKDARLVEVVLRESTRIVRMDQGHLIVECGPGWVCANAGVDESNGVEPDSVVLLPRDADASARALRDHIAAETQTRVAVVITDTFGRPWRDGLVEVALGVAGIDPLLDLRGERDLNGRELHHTVVAHADELAGAAGLLMRKGSGIAAVIVRGYAFAPAEASAHALIRRREQDLFR